MGSFFKQAEDDIPLGGAAENLVAGLHKQDTLKIPFHAVLAEGQDPLGDGHGQMAKRQTPGEHEEVWSLQDTTATGTMSNPANFPGQPHQYLPEEEEPPGMIRKSDTINSSTLFVNPNHVHGTHHPLQYHEGGQGGSSQHQGVKRRHSECEAEPPPVQVIVVRGGREEVEQQPDQQLIEQQQPDQQLIFPDVMDEIPLGGSAEINVTSANQQQRQSTYANLHKQDTLKIPFDAVLQEGQGQPKMELYCQDSNQSWSIGLDQQQHSSVPTSHPSPTGQDPSTVNYPGPYQFDVKFSQLSRQGKNKHWDYSTDLRKLFIDMNKWVQAEFRVGPTPPDGLWIRALPVYAEATHIREPVRRCPNHASPSDPTNQPPEASHPTHLIRLEGSDTLYCEDKLSGRLSVIFQVLTPHQGSEFTQKLAKFMCLGSDVGGINRRPLKVIFTLESELSESGVGRVVGRKVVDIRICSCPKRDRQQEEQRAQQQEEQARRIAQRFATSTVVVQPSSVPPPGKKKLEKEKVIMVPVHVDDFKKMNEFAEAAWVCRDLANSAAIKERRRQLLEEHNRDLIRKLDKKPS